MFVFPSNPLVSDRLALRKICKADLAHLYSVHSDPAVNRYIPYTTWESHADADAWWQRVENRMAEGKALQFAICQQDSGQVIGSCVLFAYEEAHGRVEIGYVLGQAYWGQGYAREAVQRLLAFCFEDVGIRHIEARVDARNQASAGLLQRLGFRREGCQKAWEMDGETPVDSMLFALLSRQWTGPRY